MATDFYTNEDGFIQYIASAGQSKFAFDFTVRSVDEVITYVNGTEVNESLVELSPSGDGGFVTIDSVLEETVVTLRRNIDSARVTSFTNTGYITAELLNKEFDNIAREIGQIQHNLKSKVGTSTTFDNSSIGVSVDPKAGSVIGWDSEGLNLENKDVASSEELENLREEVDALYNRVEDLEPLGDGVWMSDLTFTGYNQYLTYEGRRYQPIMSTTLPYTTTTKPDLTKVEIVGSPNLDVREALRLKIFPTYTSGLTKVESFIGLVSQVFQVRRVYDNALVNIFKDKEGLIPLIQDGYKNISNDDASVVFYIDSGKYYLSVNEDIAGFEIGSEGALISLVEQHNNDVHAHPELSTFITSEADRAETAADAATLSGNVYEDTVAGLAATTSGQYFSVISPSVDGYLDLYLNQIGVAEFKKRYPSSEYIDDAVIISAAIRRDMYSEDIKVVAGDWGTQDNFTSNNYTWVLAKPIVSSTALTSLRFYCQSDATNISYKIFKKVGTNLVTVYNSPVVSYNTGANTVVIDNQFAGKEYYLGLYSSKGLGYVTGKSSEGYYGGDGNLTTVNTTSGPILSSISLLLEFSGDTLKVDDSLNSIVENATDIVAVSDRVEVIETGLEYRDTILGEADFGDSPAAIVSGGNWVIEDVIEDNLTIDKLTVFISGIVQGAKLRSYRRVGDSFTIINEVPLVIPDNTTGKYTFDVALPVIAGDLLGLYMPAGVFGNNGVGSKNYNLFYTPSELTVGQSFTDSSSIRVRFDWAFEVTRDKLQKLDEVIIDTQELNDTVFSEEILLGSGDLVDTAKAVVSGGNWVINSPIDRDTVITKVDMYIRAYSTQAKLRTYRKNGNDLTVINEQALIMPVGVVGLHSFSVALEVQQGDLIGVYMPANVFGFESPSSISYGLLYSPNILSVGDTFSDDTASNFKFDWGFYTKDNSIVSDNTSRIQALEASQSIQKALPFNYNMILGVGQSLMEGSYTTGLAGQTPITTTQEYDTLGFQGGVNNGAINPATVATTQFNSRGEWSGLGGAKHLKDLLAQKNNIPTSAPKHTLVINNDGRSGASLEQIAKGGLYGKYETTMQKVGLLQNLTGDTDSGVLAITFMQGEADNGSNQQEWKERLHNMVTDFNTDIKLATGQSKDVNLFSYQLCTYRNVALTQLEANNEYENIKVASPIYHLPYYDRLHINAQAERYMGGYFAKAIHAVEVESKDWQPLKPIDVRYSNEFITITFNRFGLNLDTTSIPLQTDYGFFVNNGVSNVNILNVNVINSNQIRIQVSSPVSDGWVVGYGTPQVGLSPMEGWAGNLRDNSGIDERIDGYPLHDWCCLFDLTL